MAQRSPNSRDSNRAETPRLSRAIHHAARSHLRNGVRVREQNTKGYMSWARRKPRWMSR